MQVPSAHPPVNLLLGTHLISSCNSGETRPGPSLRRDCYTNHAVIDASVPSPHGLSPAQHLEIPRAQDDIKLHPAIQVLWCHGHEFA